MGEEGYTSLERRWARPTFDVYGLWGGYQGEGAKTVLPATAGAKFSFRLVPNQDPAKITAGAEVAARRAVPAGHPIELIDHPRRAGVLVPLDSPYVEAAARAIEHAFGRRPVFTREGGSIPIVTTFHEQLDADALLLGWGQEDDNCPQPQRKVLPGRFPPRHQSQREAVGRTRQVRKWEARDDGLPCYALTTPLLHARSQIHADENANWSNRTASTAASRSMSTASSQLEADAARPLQFEVEELNRKANEVSKSIGKAKDPAEREARKEEGRQLREQTADASRRSWSELAAELDAHPPADPQPLASRRADRRGRQGEPRIVPRQDAAADSSISSRWTTSQLAEKLDLVDFEGGASVAGHGFYFLKNEAVLLELALQRYAVEMLLAKALRRSPRPTWPATTCSTGIGFIPRGPETQIYSIENSDLSLVATAEITLGGMLAGQTLDAEALPLKFCGISHCFRTEAGAHGRATRGLYRVHQFTKIEMFAFTLPERKRRHARPPSRPGVPPVRRPGHSLPRGRYGHRRPRRPGLSQVRPRSLDARPRRVRRSDQHQQLHRLPGPAAEHSLPREGRKGHAFRPHAQRHRHRHQPRADRHSGELPAGRRLDRHSGGLAAIRWEGDNHKVDARRGLLGGRISEGRQVAIEKSVGLAASRSRASSERQNNEQAGSP